MARPMAWRLWMAALAMLAGAALLWAGPASAKTLRWSNDQDVFSLDPYARQETFLLSFVSNIYEPLVRRDRELRLEPALAQRWFEAAPDRWRFELRRGVRFQDGTPFTADDVVFSFARASGPGSNLANALAHLRSVTKVDDFTVDIETNGPDPILPQEIAIWDIMSAKWCSDNDAMRPADALKGEESYAADHANGTGPFMIETRRPDIETVLVPNQHWWDQPEHNLDRAIFRPMAAKDGVAALLTGNLDMVDAVPPQATERIARAPGLHLIQGPELRTIFLGFDFAREELVDSSAKGRNPFRDRRVRQAFYQAIDENAIRTKVMRGFATPAGLLVGPGVLGFDPSLNQRLPYDPGAAKSLLAEAGYPNGFSAAMDCPNDRYVNDEAICDAVVAMLAKIGVKLRLNAATRSKFFAKLLQPDYRSSFFLLGWAPPTYDALNTLVNFAATRMREAHQGDLNFGAYSNPELDVLVGKIAHESDEPKRLDLLRQALVLVKDDIAYIPLHQQEIVWAARNNVDLVQEADGSFPLRYVRVK
jgi:peptide/nickel transport system substrate-binding protein